MRLRFVACLYSAVTLSLGAQEITAVAPLHKSAGIEIVQVYLNATGPYPFVLDTGANVSMVKRRLLRQLAVPITGAVTVAASLGEGRSDRVDMQSVSIAGLGVEHVEINTLEGPELGVLETQVEGILGENFLRQFDLLLDNDKQVLVLDRSAHLENSLVGERLPIAESGSFNGEPTTNRLLVSLRLPALLKRPMLFLVDSGANTAMLYPFKGELGDGKKDFLHGSIHSLNTNRRCGVERTALNIGTQSLPLTVVATCEGMTRDKADTDGLLPTSIFHRLFIDHKSAYLIVNPRHANEVGKD